MVQFSWKWWGCRYSYKHIKFLILCVSACICFIVHLSIDLSFCIVHLLKIILFVGGSWTCLWTVRERMIVKIVSVGTSHSYKHFKIHCSLFEGLQQSRSPHHYPHGLRVSLVQLWKCLDCDQSYKHLKFHVVFWRPLDLQSVLNFVTLFSFWAMILRMGRVAQMIVHVGC